MIVPSSKSLLIFSFAGLLSLELVMVCVCCSICNTELRKKFAENIWELFAVYLSPALSYNWKNVYEAL
jgi:hypothetical protein